MKRKLNFKNKKIWLSTIGTMSLMAVPILVSSCSSVSQTAINNSFLTSPDGNLTSNLTLKDISTMSLKDPDGMKSYISAISKQITYNWLLNAIKSDKKLKAAYDAKVKEINKNYDDQVKSYKKEHGADWALKFQQEVLDKNGGTEEAYKNNQLYDYAKTQFTTEVLKNLFLGVFDTNAKKIILDPSQDQILDGLYGISNTEKTNSGSKAIPQITYKFDSNTLLTSNDTLDPQYAAFQDYLFSQYVQYTNPYIVNMSLWKYGTPTLGITNYYNIQTNSSNGDNNGDGENGGGDSGGGESGGESSTSYSLNSKTTREGESGDSEGGDGSGDSGTTTPTTGTYVYPYFGNENETNAAFGTLTKFTKFLEGAATDKNYITNQDLGLKDIPLVYTEDSSTYILAKNSSIFSDLYTEFAAGATYLYGILGTSAGVPGAGGFATNINKLTDLKNQITHNIDISDTSKNNGLDIITSNFVSKANPYTRSEEVTASSNTNINPLQLSATLVDEIINTDGPLKTLGTAGNSTTEKQNQNVYVIDSFIPGTIKTSKQELAPQNNTNLDEYMFLRNQAGVHAISIDGSKLIGKATTEQERKQYAGDIVLYRYLMGSKGNATFKVDLNSELSSFLSANFDWLVYNYATSSNLKLLDGETTNKQDMFNVDFLNSNEKSLATAISTFLPNLNYYGSVTTASQKMMEAKAQYNSNYGYDTYKNGFAAPWSYNLVDEAKAKENNINKNYLYENALLSATGTNPYSNGMDKNNSLYSNVLTAISALVSTGLEKQSSSFEGYKYSQYLYSNSYYINAALNTVLANTNLVKASIENNIYKEYLGDFVNVGEKSINASNLSNGLYNFFFLNNLNSETNKWFSYNPKTSEPNNVLSDVKNYSYQLWNDNNSKDESTKITNFNSIYSILATAKYLIGDDGSYSNLLNYIRSTIGDQKAYFVWENSINSNLKALQPIKSSLLENETSQPITSKSLIEMTTVTQNINNQFSGAYFGNGNSSTTTPLTNNLSKDTLYQTTANTSYYSTTTNKVANQAADSSTFKVGYKGLQLSSGSSISSDVTNALFTKPTDYNIGEIGILAAYGSLDQLIKTINNIPTHSQLSTFINTLEKTLNYKYDFNSAIIGLDLTLAQKKEIVTKDIKEQLQDKSELFKKFTGYVGKNGASSSQQPSAEDTQQDPNAFASSSNSANLYGAYAIQVTASDFSSLSTLRQALNSENADDLINQLVIQYASSGAVQKLALSSIIGNKQVEAFDVRVKDAFGADGIYWLKNYK